MIDVWLCWGGEVEFGVGLVFLRLEAGVVAPTVSKREV